MTWPGYQSPLYDYHKEESVVPSVRAHLCRCRNMWRQVHLVSRCANTPIGDGFPLRSTRQKVWLSAKDLPLPALFVRLISWLQTCLFLTCSVRLWHSTSFLDHICPCLTLVGLPVAEFHGWMLFPAETCLWTFTPDYSLSRQLCFLDILQVRQSFSPCILVIKTFFEVLCDCAAFGSKIRTVS